MILFLFGFSLCLNLFLILLFIFFYKKYIPIFKSSSNFNVDFSSSNDDFLEGVSNFINAYRRG